VTPRKRAAAPALLEDSDSAESSDEFVWTGWRNTPGTRGRRGGTRSNSILLV
jgi:hypothetical protein